MLIISTGCPAGIGPEVSVAAAARVRSRPRVLVGDGPTIHSAAELVGVARSELVPFDGDARRRDRIHVCSVGHINPSDRRPGRPSKAAGRAQLDYVNTAVDLVLAAPGRVLVTGPVSKAAIARSGARGATRFLGHTEWLRDRDGAKVSVMCFVAPRLVTSLATTHVPIARLPAALTPETICDAAVWLGRLLVRMGRTTPTLAVCSLNPHAGESELLGKEERLAILPGMRRAARMLGRSAHLVGPIGAETAYRKAHAGLFDGVVAMYHDQATIPTKLVAFGEAVNVTMGLSFIRTSVDHGTGYDIAWRGTASPNGMVSALRLAARLAAPPP
jgi:4-phospho-D-threonate 3-dehydrogenase / 4-phospho-D-erythronate 3-dehydrogenase